MVASNKGLNLEILGRVIESHNKKYGKGAVYLLSEKEDGGDVVRIPTKLPDLDRIIGGGLPEGRIIELYGKESAGKTSLAYHLCSLFKVRAFIDSEGAFDRKRCRDVFGNVVGRMLLRKPDTGEQALELVLDFAKAGMPLVVVDSVAAMLPQSTFDKKVDDNARIGALAKMMAENLPKLATICNKTGTTVLFINQERDKIGGMTWGDPHTTPGGRALKHFSSLRIRVARKGPILKSGKKVGIVSKLKVVKSKVSDPEGEAELPLYFATGFNVPAKVVKRNAARKV
jgi:recombination protein RecA